MMTRRYDLALAVALAFSFLGCSEEIRSDGDAVAAETPKISLASAKAAVEPASYRTHLYSELDADVHSRLDADEVAGSGALVKAIHVEIGDRVRANQLLATLEDDDMALAVELAQADLDEAVANYERVRELKERELVSPSEYDAATFAKRRAEANLKWAQLNFERTRVRAPFAGVVSRRYVREGEEVTEGTRLFRVTAMAPLRARMLVPEEQAPAFQEGARIRLRGATGRTAVGQVILVSPTVDPGSGTREVIVELPETSDLPPGAAVIAEPAPSVGAIEQ